MPEIDVAALKEQIFGNNGQSPTQPQTPVKPQEEVPAKPEDTTTTQVEEKPTSTTTTPTEEQEEVVVDANEYLKNNLGFDDWEIAKSTIADLKKKAETPAEIKFANEQSERLFKAIQEGKDEEVYDILNTKMQLSKLDKMGTDEILKLHIDKTNKKYTADDIQDVFDEKYAYPEKPVQSDTEEDDDFKIKEEKWKQAKEKIDRRKQRDAISAKDDLLKLNAELKLPDIPKPQAVDTKVVEEQEKALQQLEVETKEAYSKLSPKDISMVFKFNDEASKLAFDIQYEPDKESFEKARSLASDMKAFFESYYDKDGSPLRTEFLKDLYAGRNIDKIVSEAIVAATNQTKKWFLANQKNINNGTQRNYTIPPVTEIDKLKTAVFGK